MAACRHTRGKHDGQRAICDECGQEFIRIGGVWWYVIGWVRLAESFFEDRT
jgi:hypothetical protein